MNIASAELLENSLQNLGRSAAERRQMAIEAAYRQSQLGLEKQRVAQDTALRQAQLQYAIDRGKAEDTRAAAAQRTADASEKRLSLANQPHIQADLKSDDGQTMTFTGTPDQLNGLIASAKQQGKNITVSNKKDFAAQFDVGGAKFSFSDQDAANKFADQMADRGIDVYAASGGKAPTPNERTITVHHPAGTDQQGHPAVTHWFGPDEPAKPDIPGTPAWDEVLKEQVPQGQPMPTNAPFALPPAGAPAPNAPAPLVPGMGNVALNTNGVPTGKPDPRDVQWLSQNPNPQRIAKFESVYGKGSSSAFLAPPPQANAAGQ